MVSSSDIESSQSPQSTVNSASDGQSSAGSVTSTSQVLAGVQQVSDWVRASWLYRWLTKGPDPDVIVIDLRETYTIGPFIRVLNAVLERAAPYWEQSRLNAMIGTLVAWLEQLAETRVGQLVLKLLTPPEPPEERTDGEAKTTESTGNLGDQATDKNSHNKDSR